MRLGGLTLDITTLPNQDLSAENSQNLSGESDLNKQYLVPPISISPQTDNSPCPNFLVDEYQLPTISFNPVSIHVQLKLKKQIWEGKFIDLPLLLNTVREFNSHFETRANSNSEQHDVPHKAKT